MPAKKEGIKRVRIDKFTEGGWMKLPNSRLMKDTVHEWWQGGQTGGKVANNAQHIAGKVFDGGPDVLKFIKGQDPMNTSGSVQPALDIMTKLQDATMANSLFTSIQPLQNILGSQLYSAFAQSGSSGAAAQKTQDKPDVIKLLIAAALELVRKEHGNDKATEAARLLDNREINLIEKAYNDNALYASEVEISEFVDAINKLIPIFRKTYGK